MMNKQSDLRKIVLFLGRLLGENFYVNVLLTLAFYYVFFNYYLVFFYKNFPLYTRGGAYLEPSFLWASIENLGFLLAVSLAVLPLVLLWERTSWKEFDYSFVKVFIFITALSVGWDAALSEYNYFFDQAFILERILLLIFLCLFLFHPVFISPFMVVYLTFDSQLTYFRSFSSIDHALTIELLLLFVAYLVVKALSRCSDKVLFYCFLTLFASNYFASGLAKLNISPNYYEWPLYNSLELSFGWARYLGWLTSLSLKFQNFLMEFLVTFNRPLLVGAFLLEFAVLFILFRREFAYFLLTGLVLFHLMTCLVIGLFLWGWIIPLILTFVFLYKIDPDETATIFRDNLKRYFSIILIVSMAVTGFVITPSLGWWETRYNFRFDVVAINKLGEEFLIKPSAFAPHRETFSSAYNFFLKLVNEKTIRPATRDFQQALEINRSLETTEDLNRLKLQYGVNRYQPELAQKVSYFIRVYYQNYQSMREKNYIAEYLLGTFALPTPHLVKNSTRARDLNDLEGKIERFVIRFKEGVYEGGSTRTLSSREVLEIPVGPSEGFESNRPLRFEHKF